MCSLNHFRPWIIACALLALGPTTASADHDHTINSTGVTCLSAPVLMVRYGHGQTPEPIRLTSCDGEVNPGAIRALSILARPRRVPAPGPASESTETAVREGWITNEIRSVSPGLLTRLQAIANQWPGQVITIVSGHRPRSRSTSRHHHAQALDIQVANVAQREVASFARTLADTGVGYYPNSLFTHIDVRERSAFWVDLSRPGERSRYVAASERDAYLAPPTPSSDVAIATLAPSQTQAPAEAEPASSPSVEAPPSRSQAMQSALAHVEALRASLEARRTRAAASEQLSHAAETVTSAAPATPAANEVDDVDVAPVGPERVARMLANAAALAEGDER